MATRVLVAYDESPQAESALRHALEKYPDGGITVVHVNDPREWVFIDDAEGGFYSESSYEQVKESAEEVLSEAEGIAAEFDAEVETEMLTGYPAEEIIDYADEHDADHIVLGSHGRRGIERFLLGSVAERVARRSPTSVTIIRHDEDD